MQMHLNFLFLLLDFFFFFSPTDQRPLINEIASYSRGIQIFFEYLKANRSSDLIVLQGLALVSCKVRLVVLVEVGSSTLQSSKKKKKKNNKKWLELDS